MVTMQYQHQMSNPSKDTELRQPKMQQYCAALYDYFEATATIEDVEGTELQVWQGQLTQATKQVGIPDGVYKRVMDQLKTLECIEQVAQGRRSMPTIILLLRAPTLDIWKEIRSEGLTRRDEAAILRRRLDDLERRLPAGLDIVKAFSELQKQLDDLSNKFDNGTTTKTQ